MSRPVLKVCVSCTTDEEWGGQSFFDALKAARKEQGLKPLFKLKAVDCLGGCDTPCNAQLKGEDMPKLDVTWLHGENDVQALLDGACRYVKARGARTHRALELPGRPG